MRIATQLRAVAAAAAAGLAFAVVACGDDDAPPPRPAGPPASEEAAPEPGGRERARALEEGTEDRGSESGAQEAGELTADERRAAAAARTYVRALDRREGERVCELLAPGALADVELPRERSDCAASLDASIGFRDPRGMPVWRGAQVSAIPSVSVDGDRATVTVTVLTRFADRENLSVEDDIVYLVRDGGWRVAQASATLHRAVGAEPPPEAISPP